jgi:uncharacterized protein with von Willebrand factor type A (vWA) domain
MQCGGVSFSSTCKDVNIYRLGNYLAENGWSVVATLKLPSIHFTLNQNNSKDLQRFVAAVAAGMQQVKSHPKKYAQGPCSLVEKVNEMSHEQAVFTLQNCHTELLNIEQLNKEEKKKEAHEKK